MEHSDIRKLRRLGLTESTSLGAEAVRVTAQNREQLGGRTRNERRRVLEDWERDLEKRLLGKGVELVPGSLSVVGQTIEALVPVDQLDAVVADLAQGDVRVDVVTSHQVTEGS